MAQSYDRYVKSITASTTQTQAGGTVAQGDVNLCTVANASDAVTLPANLPSGTIVYLRGGANAGLLFPPVGGAFNGGTANASVALAASVITTCICTGSNNFLVNKGTIVT